jgi:hypothetical protein
VPVTLALGKDARIGAHIASDATIIVGSMTIIYCTAQDWTFESIAPQARMLATLLTKVPVKPLPVQSFKFLSVPQNKRAKKRVVGGLIFIESPSLRYN